ncbi:UDP-glucose 4-epimerase-like isoform X2 [Tachypleus tridentatus]|uniref:UDP-glucose 4-epimerase-like isoform X2 n=1 Tax=Tachypleus tridentatus TaxID=6853 RepID=UPI003FD3B26B
MTTALITGAAGYIGSHITVALLDAGYNVVAVDNCVNASSGNGTTPPVIRRIQEITDKTVIFYKTDVVDKGSLREIFSKHKPDYVIHVAALKKMGESVDIPLEYYCNNIGSLLTLLENLTAVALRYFSPVGAHETGQIGEDPVGPPSQLVAFICQVAVGRRPQLNIFGDDFNTADGTVERDYVHVMDLALGNVAVLRKMHETSSYKGFMAYNLGVGKSYSVLQMINTFEKVSGKRIPFAICKNRGIDVPRLCSDIYLARKELQWEPRRTLDGMCRDTWRWFSNNPQGYS